MKWAKRSIMKWAYGITTVPDRQYSYLPRTVESLKYAGFDKPTLFVDGANNSLENNDHLYKVYRGEKIKAFGNWLLCLMELWIRNPHADNFAIFQDDLIAYRNLRDYLDHHRIPENGYWNLYTFPQNENIHGGRIKGWYLSNQRGRGAVALVFSNDVVFKLLTSPIIMYKPKDGRIPHRNIDGAIVTALGKLQVREYVHYPTLIQHTGDCSTIGNRQHEKPRSWMGEDYDAMELLKIKHLQPK